MNEIGAPPERGDRDLSRETEAIMSEEAGAPVKLRRRWKVMLHGVECPRLSYIAACDCDGPELLGEIQFYLKKLAKGETCYTLDELPGILTRLHHDGK